MGLLAWNQAEGKHTVADVGKAEHGIAAAKSKTELTRSLQEKKQDRGGIVYWGCRIILLQLLGGGGLHNIPALQSLQVRDLVVTKNIQFTQHIR